MNDSKVELRNFIIFRQHISVYFECGGLLLSIILSFDNQGDEPATATDVGGGCSFRGGFNSSSSESDKIMECLANDFLLQKTGLWESTVVCKDSFDLYGSKTKQNRKFTHKKPCNSSYIRVSIQSFHKEYHSKLRLTGSHYTAFYKMNIRHPMFICPEPDFIWSEPEFNLLLPSISPLSLQRWLCGTKCSNSHQAA